MEFENIEKKEEYLNAIQYALKLCDPTPELKPERDTIVGKLHRLLEEVSPNLPLEKGIPLLLEREPHNFLVIDSFNVLFQKNEETDFIWSFRNSKNDIDRISYKRWFDHLKCRLWPPDVGEMLLEFSENVVKICYDGYVIVQLKNIKYTKSDARFNSVLDSLSESDSKSQGKIMSKFLLVKIVSEFEKLFNSEDPEKMTYNPLLCLDSRLSNVHLLSSFVGKNKGSSKDYKSTKVYEPAVASCSKNFSKTAEVVAKDGYSLCQMALYLASRSYTTSDDDDEATKVATYETFLFKYFCKSKNQTVLFKVLKIARTRSGRYSITQASDKETCTFTSEYVEVENKQEVDKVVHSIYHNCLNEFSYNITVFHKFNHEEFQEIFDIAFKDGTKLLSLKTNLPNTSNLEKQRRENPAVSLIRVSHVEPPIESKYVKEWWEVSEETNNEETNKSRCLPYEDVHGWFEAKEKYKFELNAGIQHMGRDSRKGRRNVLLAYSSYEDVVKEITRLKRMLEEDTESQESNKRARIEEPDTSNVEQEQTVSESLMEVDENPPNAQNDLICEDDQNASEVLSEDSDSQPLDAYFQKFIDDPDIPLFYDRDEYESMNHDPSPFEEILDLCLKNKERLEGSQEEWWI